MSLSVVQKGISRAKLCATSNRSKGSRVQSTWSACRTRATEGISSTMNRASAITVLVKSGFWTESRPTSARNWISRKETGDTPQGRYRPSQGNSVSRFDSRTSHTKKWVSRRTLTVRTASWKQRPDHAATTTTTDPLHRHAALSKVSCIPEQLWRSLKRRALPAAAQPVALCVRPQLPRPEGLHRGDETSVFSLQMRSRFSYGQLTRLVAFEQGERFSLPAWREKNPKRTKIISRKGRQACPEQGRRGRLD